MLVLLRKPICNVAKYSAPELAVEPLELIVVETRRTHRAHTRGDALPCARSLASRSRFVQCLGESTAAAAAAAAVGVLTLVC
mmetsp:Transcript_161457/g.518490  ORF Transcript_161457/g.518490 Transcript_161457/m.518490 type:complete len:82 (-) Transcript_161457:147-392(-)